MVDLALEQNEHIICRTKEAWRFDGKEERELESLFLTNKNLISVYKKSIALFFDGKTVVDKKPLSLISISNNLPQVNHIRDENFGEVLQIMYDDGREELYSFYDAPKSEFWKWKDSIEQAIKENSKIIAKGKRTVDDSIVAEKSKQGEESFVSENQMEEPYESVENMRVIEPANISENNGMFVFCTSCGEKNNIGAKFCQSCGVSLVNANKPKQNSELDKGNHKLTYSERRQEFVGKIYKCPNCGEVLKSFMTNCPSCGFELRGIETPSAIREFALRLEKIESQKMIEERDSIIKKIFGVELEKSKDEKRERERNFIEQKKKEKANLILNFPIPNTKEDILEFLFLASSNISKKEINDTVTKAWISKMEQIYKKAEKSMGQDEDFKQIKYMYQNEKAEIRKAKCRQPLIIVGFILLYIFIMGLLIDIKSTITFTVVVVVLFILGFILYKHMKSKTSS